MLTKLRKGFTVAAILVSACYAGSALATAPTKEEVKSACGQSGGSYSSGSNYSRCEYSNGSYTCNYDEDKCETCINGKCTVESRRPGQITGLLPKTKTLAPPTAPTPPKPIAPAKPAPTTNVPPAPSQTGQLKPAPIKKAQ